MTPAAKDWSSSLRAKGTLRIDREIRAVRDCKGKS